MGLVFHFDTKKGSFIKDVSDRKKEPIGLLLRCKKVQYHGTSYKMKKQPIQETFTRTEEKKKQPQSKSL